jgi:hypothetical protein
MKTPWMKFSILGLGLFLLACAPGIYPTGGGVGFINLGNPGETPISAWYAAPSNYQVSHIYKIVDALNSTGVRCPTNPPTVAAIRYDLLTRANQGRIQGEEKLLDWVYIVLADAGCGVQTAEGFTPLSVKFKEPVRSQVQSSAPVSAPPKSLTEYQDSNDKAIEFQNRRRATEADPATRCKDPAIRVEFSDLCKNVQ